MNTMSISGLVIFLLKTVVLCKDFFMSSNIKITGLYTNVLTFAIFYLVLINSLLQDKFSITVVSLSRLFVFGVLALLALWNTIFYKDIGDKLNYVVFILLAVFLALLKDSQFSILLLFAIFCSLIDPYMVMRAYFRGILYGVIIVSLASLLGYIPKMLGNIWVFGFSNPNAIGFLIATEILTYITLHWKKITFTDYLIFIIGLLFEKIVLSDDTATIVLIIFMIIYLMSKKQSLFPLISKLTIMAPIFLFSFSWFISNYYGRYSWIAKFSKIITDRPEIWSYYLNIYGVHLLPQKITLFFATDFQRAFFGGNLSNLYAGFDTSYIYMLLSDGLLLSFFIIFVLTYFANKIKTNPALICFTFSIFIFGFTETAVLTPLAYYQSVILIIAFASFINRNYFKKVNKNIK